MGKKKQRKGAPDLDDDEFPEPSDAATVDTDPVDVPTAAPKKQDKKKKAKKVDKSALILCQASKQCSS